MIIVMNMALKIEMRMGMEMEMEMGMEMEMVMVLDHCVRILDQSQTNKRRAVPSGDIWC